MLNVYRRVQDLWRFAIVDNPSVSGGVVLHSGDQRASTQVTSANITRSISQVSREQRHARNRHKGAVVWFTGLSGAGKTTIAREVYERLRRLGARVELLDGDEIRSVFPNTGFSRSERDAHVRRVGFLASRLERHGVTVIASLVSPYRESRDFVRSLCERFVEIHVSTPLTECERRDPKGLYRRARAGEIAQFTGIDDPYERPESPELTIDARALAVDDAAGRVVDHLVNPFASVAAPPVRS